MNKQLTLAIATGILLIAFCSCGHKVADKAIIKAKPGLVIGNPIGYYNDSTLLFPVGCDYKLPMTTWWQNTLLLEPVRYLATEELLPLTLLIRLRPMDA